jgi:hypothetical protein
MATQIFVVIAKTGVPAIGEALKNVAPEGTYSIKDDAWLVQFEGTSQDLAEKLGIRDAKNGTGIVMPITNYSGRGPLDMWEWLRVHWPKDVPR